MKCPRCSHENQEGASFCSNCGNQLELVCQVCSEPSPVDARFCWNCGNGLAVDSGNSKDLSRYIPPEMLTKIRSARSDDLMRGERRTVTMLFADVQGSTAAAEGLDPEDWADIINGAFERLIAPVYRYEGTLARLQGDAVLAFFGAPIAHEDDPVRAVMAGLEMVEAIEPYRTEIMERWSVPLAIRVGINTGLVVVGEVGSDLRVEYTALGDAVNVAARMEQTAKPGTVRITEETWKQVQGQFEVTEIGPVEVKGKSEPVVAYRAIAPVSGADESSELVPLVGRSEELASLEMVRDRVLGGTGRLASIMGEAGVGKTRLLREFRTRTADAIPTATSVDEAGDLGWVAASSRSYDSSVPYATIRDMLVRWWRLDEFDDGFDRIGQILDGIQLDDVHDLAVYLGHIAGVSLPPSSENLLENLEPPVRQGRARKAVVAYLEAEARRRPVVVAFEDIHWSDAMTLVIIEDLMDLADRVPVGMVFTMRPYRDEPTWHIHEVAQRDHPHRYEQIELVNLGDDAIQDLLEGLLEGVELGDETRTTILQRSDGNPLFIAQMARAIREGGGDDVVVPTGLTSLLTARLDRLDDESRSVAQLASVIGTEFDRSILAALVGDESHLGKVVGDLLRREVLVELNDPPGVLAFYHSLMQDAAYSTMLLRTRRELHARVAAHLIDSQPEAVEEIAQHLMDAGDTESAFPYLVAAGEKSARAMALSEAIRFFTTALERMPANPDPDVVVRAHDGLGLAYALVPDLTKTEASYQQLVDYADDMGRPSDKVRALNQLAMSTATISGDFDAARRYLSEAYSVASEVGDQFGLAQYHMNSCSIAGMGGDLWTSAQHDEQTIATGREMGSDEIRRAGMYALAENTAWLLDTERAVPAVEDALQAAIEADDELGKAHVEALALSQLRQAEGDLRGAVNLLLDNEATLVRYGDFEAPIVAWWAGTLLYELGDIETGVSRVDQVRRDALEAGGAMYVAISSATLARMYASLGVEENLAELREAAVEALQKPMGEYQASTVWADLGWANLALGRTDAAEADFKTGQEVSSVTQYWEKPRLLVGRATVLAQAGRFDEAHGYIDEAQTYVLEKGFRFHDPLIARARGDVLFHEGKPSDALAKLAEARDLADVFEWRAMSVSILRLLAQAASAAGDSEAAAEYAARTRAEISSIASSIVNDELRAAMEKAWLAPLEGIPTG